MVNNQYIVALLLKELIENPIVIIPTEFIHPVFAKGVDYRPITWKEAVLSGNRRKQIT